MDNKMLIYIAVGLGIGYFMFGATCESCKKKLADGSCK